MQILVHLQHLYQKILINKQAFMGICTNKQKAGEQRLSTKAVLETKDYDKMHFYFTTENLLRIDADCLVIYCDQKMNLKKNAFVANVGKFQTRKIKQFAESHLLTTKAKVMPGQIIFFPISISTLQFRFIGMVCLRVWNGEEKIRLNLKQLMSNLFIDLNRHRVQSLAITQFNQQFGIPAQLGCRLLAEQLFASRDWLKVATIICNDTQNQNYYMERIISFKKLEQKQTASIRDSGSNYY